jgi:hypothetical protein
MTVSLTPTPVRERRVSGYSIPGLSRSKWHGTSLPASAGMRRPSLAQIFHRKARKDRKGPPYFRKLGRLDCSERSSSTLACSLVRAGNTGGVSACFASFAVQMQCLGLVSGRLWGRPSGAQEHALVRIHESPSLTIGASGRSLRGRWDVPRRARAATSSARPSVRNRSLRKPGRGTTGRA